MPEDIPIQRSPEMQRAFDQISKALGGETVANAQAEARCHHCKKRITEFRTDVSRREYQISGLCQSCQDIAFAPPEDEGELEDAA